MKTTNRFQDRSGVTLLELLLVVLIVGILAMIFLPALARAKARTRQVDCLSQLRQIGIAHHSFAHEHNSRFPFQVPVREGGTLEIVQTAAWPVPLEQWALPHFRALSNDLIDPKVLTCPSDDRTRVDSFGKLRSENLSYFICVNSEYNSPEDVLCGDRNIRNNTTIPIIRITQSAFLLWTGEIHEYEGNVLFAGGHVRRVDSVGLRGLSAGRPDGLVALLPPDPVSPPNSSANSSSGGNGSDGGSANAAASFERFFQSLSGSPKPNPSSPPASPSSTPSSTAASSSSSPSRVDPTAMTAGRRAPSLDPVTLGQPETNRMQLAARTSPRTPSPSAPSPPALTDSPEPGENPRAGVSGHLVAGERSFWWFLLAGIVVAAIVAILVYRHDRRRMVRSTTLRRTVSYGLMAERRRRGRVR